MRADRKATFYCLASLLTLVPAVYGISRLATGQELWYLRAEVGAGLGPGVILLSVPMYLLAFYASLEDAKTISGRIFALLLALGAICSTLICGRRSLLLIPLILIVLSYFRYVRFWRTVVLACACVVAAAALLPLYRGAYQDKRLRQDNLVAEIIHNDFSRRCVGHCAGRFSAGRQSSSVLSDVWLRLHGAVLCAASVGAVQRSFHRDPIHRVSGQPAAGVVELGVWDRHVGRVDSERGNAV